MAKALDFVRQIAVARIMMPKSAVRLSAGRTAMSDELQALCFLAGANSIFYGEKLLTTGNPDTERDQAQRTQQAFGGSASQPVRVASNPQRGGSYAGGAPSYSGGSSSQWGADDDVPANAGFDVDLPPTEEETGRGSARKDSLDVPDFLK